jgi:hypothetical protein
MLTHEWRHTPPRLELWLQEDEQDWEFIGSTQAEFVRVVEVEYVTGLLESCETISEAQSVLQQTGLHQHRRIEAEVMGLEDYPS